MSFKMTFPCHSQKSPDQTPFLPPTGTKPITDAPARSRAPPFRPSPPDVLPKQAHPDILVPAPVFPPQTLAATRGLVQALRLAYPASRADGWMIAGGLPFEESPDSMKEGCRVTPGGGNPRESATEKRLP